MENRTGTRSRIENRPAQFFLIRHFLFSIFLVSAGCGAPGDPVPPSPPVPAAIKDLVARQAGDGIQLSFTLPASSITGEKLRSEERRVGKECRSWLCRKYGYKKHERERGGT